MQKLTHITLPQGLEIIGEQTFYHCDNLAEVVLPETVTHIGARSFKDCPKLKKLNIPDSVNYIGISFIDFKNFEYEDYNGLLYLDNVLVGIKEDEISYNSIKWKKGTIGICNAFKNNSEIETISLPDGIKFIGPASFDGCTNLISVTMPDSVISIGHAAFFGCKKLPSIRLSENTAFIDIVSFRDCKSLENIDIPDNVEEIEQNAFEGCENLKKLTLGSKLDKIGHAAFYQCRKLASVTIPKSVSYIGQGVFFDCGLSDVNFEENSSLQTIGRNVGRSETGMDGTFSYCKYLTEIKLPDSVTYIGDYIFEGCDLLKTVYLPKSLKSIGSNLFANIETLIYEGTIEEWNNISKGTRWFYPYNYYNYGELTEITLRCKDGEITISRD